MTEQVHTIRNTEQRLRSLVLGAVAAAVVIDVILVALGWPLSPLGWVATAIAAALLSLCVRRIINDKVSVGMIPVAIFSLGFAGLAGGIVPVAAIGLAVLAFFLVWFVILRSAYVPKRTIDADAALIVLGCAVRNGQPGGTLTRRLQVAKDLLNESPARICIVTGGPVPGENQTEANIMAAWLTNNGIDPARIIVEREALNTEQNLAFAYDLLDARNHTSQHCVISSDYHLWRMRAIAHKAGLTPEPVPIPAPTPARGWLTQWCREVLVTMDWLL